MTKIRLSENVVFRSFGSETVLLNLSTGQYHGLKGTGGRMLELLEENGDLETVARQISEEYDHPFDEVLRDLRALCSALAERSLIEMDEPGER